MINTKQIAYLFSYYNRGLAKKGVAMFQYQFLIRRKLICFDPNSPSGTYAAHSRQFVQQTFTTKHFNVGRNPIFHIR